MKPDNPNYNQLPQSSEFQPEQMSDAPEQLPASQSPETPPARPEAPIVQPEKDSPRPERRVQPGTSQPSDDQTEQTTLPPVQPMPQTTADDSRPASDDSPLIADDVDVIEKTWVDKAKRIVEETKDDPYRQEQEVEKLQQSYLKKRYGKVVKPSES